MSPSVIGRPPSRPVVKVRAEGMARETERSDAAVVDALAALAAEGPRSERARALVWRVADVARDEGRAAGRREAVSLTVIALATASVTCALVALGVLLSRVH